MNLHEELQAAVGTPPPPSFELDELIRRAADRRARDRRLGVAAGLLVAAVVTTTALLAPWQHGPAPVASPTLSPTLSPSHSATPDPTPIPMPTRSWPHIPLPTRVSHTLNTTLARIGPSLGIPAGTRFTYIDLGGDYKAVDVGWGPSASWGAIDLDRAFEVSKEIYSCELVINCTEVTSADGSMTYVTGPVVAPVPAVPASTPSPWTGTSLPDITGHKHYDDNDFVFSYHADGTFVMISIIPHHAPADLTVAELVAAGLAFSIAS